jgi:hypothetical protein
MIGRNIWQHFHRWITWILNHQFWWFDSSSGYHSTMQLMKRLWHVKNPSSRQDQPLIRREVGGGGGGHVEVVGVPEGTLPSKFLRASGAFTISSLSSEQWQHQLISPHPRLETHSHMHQQLFIHICRQTRSQHQEKKENTLNSIEPHICNAIRNWPQSPEKEGLATFSTSWRSQIWSMSVYLPRIYNMTAVQYMLPCLSWITNRRHPFLCNCRISSGRAIPVHTYILSGASGSMYMTLNASKSPLHTISVRTNTLFGGRCSSNNSTEYKTVRKQRE